MSDGNIGVTRRKVLELTSGSVAVAGMAGTASATGSEDDGRVEVNVGFDGPAGRSAALDVAGEVRREFGFDAATIEVPEKAIEGLRQNPNVRYVEENGEMHALDTVPYGIELVDAIDAHDDGYRGDGASIGIIDTGIESNHESLPNVVGGAAFDQCSQSGWCGWFGNGNPCNESWDDDNDHGTHCAGTAAAPDNGVGVVGVAPDAELYSVKVLDCQGSGSYSDIAAGIEWTADQGLDVGSLSLGGSASSVVADAVEYAENNGVLLVAAAGNDGPCTDCVSYPAAYDEVMAVSATDEDDDLASFSSTGPEIEIAAPGVGVLSTVPQSDYAEFSGTSMACPHVAGAGAVLMAEGYTASQARQRLRDTADDIDLPSNEQGDGRLNVDDAAP